MQKVTAIHSVPFVYTGKAKTPYYVPALNTNYNGGQLVDIVWNNVASGEIRRPDSVSFDKGSDIPEWRASVKSKGCSLLGIEGKYSRSELLQIYEERDASTWYIWTVEVTERTTTAYIMNRAEMMGLARLFAKLDSKKDKEGKVIESKLRVQKSDKDLSRDFLKYLNELVK